MPRYTLYFVDRMSQTRFLGEERKPALREAIKWLPRNTYEAYVREESDNGVTAQWSLDPTSKKFVPFSARATFEAQIQWEEAELRKRRELLPVLDAVMEALRAAGLCEAQREPSKSRDGDTVEWSWHAPGMSLRLLVCKDEPSNVQWEIHAWGPGPCDGERTTGTLAVVDGTVALTAALIEAIHKLQRVF